VTLTYGDQVLHYKDNARISIGRSLECDIVIAQPWVSRHHATVTVHRGRVQIDDRSSSGTYIASSDGQEFFVRRETVVLVGSGRISPAIRTTDARAEIIRFDVRHGAMPADAKG
jgi:adenylate cyclase